MSIPMRFLPIHSDEIGLDNQGNLLLKSGKIILDCDGTATEVGGGSLSGTYTYAALPSALSVPAGTQAYTSDVGPVYSDGSTWVEFSSSQGSSQGSVAAGTSEAFVEQSKINSFMRGINMSGAEFADQNVPGVYNTDYKYPDTVAEIGPWLTKGFTLIRLPFRMERLQHTLGGAFDTTELGRIRTVVDYVTANGGRIILDPHNYTGYRMASGQAPKMLGDVDGIFTYVHFADFWTKLAAEFKDNPKVIFELINEPIITPAQWYPGAQAAIDAIRDAGAYNLILLPSTGYSKANGFISGGSAAQALTIVDPVDNMFLNFHQYLDADQSGTVAAIANSQIGVTRVRKATLWCRQHGYRAMLTEFNAGDNSSAIDSTPVVGLLELVDFLTNNQDVWRGYTIWGGGARWSAGYIFKMEPVSGVDTIRTVALQARTTDEVRVGDAEIHIDFVNDVVYGLQRISDALVATQPGYTLTPNAAGGYSYTAPNSLRISKYLGLTTEEARTNYFRSVNGSYTAEQASISWGGAVTPDGTRNSLLIKEDSTDNIHRAYASVISGLIVGDLASQSVFARSYPLPNTAGIYGYLKWAKPDSHQAIGVSESDKESLNFWYGDWVRVTRTLTGTSGFPGAFVMGLNPDSSPNSAAAPDAYLGDGTKGVYYWGMQVEKGGWATSPILNNGTTTVTRAADLLEFAGRALALIQAAGASVTVVLEVSNLPTYAGVYPFLTLTESGPVDKVILRRNSDFSVGSQFSDDTTQASAPLGVGSEGYVCPIKIGVSIRRTGTQRVVVGVEGVAAVGTDKTMSATTGVKLGPCSGFIRKLWIYPSFNDTTALDALLLAP